MNLSVCGINCDACNFFVENKCKGCRIVAPEGKCVWKADVICLIVQQNKSLPIVANVIISLAKC